jgi:alanyl-tRNA synthetase
MHDSKTLRQAFLDFYSQKGHSIIPSASVIPHNDPTLLFVNAGMNPFKEIFLGQKKSQSSRVTSSQKCIRVGGKHNDLDNVGHTSRHLTFFEMLGNFSFGDYFKKEAIAYAFELVKDVLKLDLSRFWVSVYEEDDEAYELWKAHIPENRIVKMDASENFWSMGATGPCGPCSELLYDRGPEFGTASNPLEDTTGERYPEFYNLVFMTYNKHEDGTLEPLANPSIDTGMGFERMLSFLNEHHTIFESDLFTPMIAQIESISAKSYQVNTPLAPSFHVIADHMRAISFAICDKAMPGNTDRGYVLRKIIRRATRYGKKLGLETPFMHKLIDPLIRTMGDFYPQLKENKDLIIETLQSEQASFYQTLKRGGNILSTIIESAKKKDHEISGEDAFKLKDTYGFPLEEILLIAKDNDCSVHLEAFNLLEERAKELSRKSRTKVSQKVTSKVYEDFLKEHEATTFMGYEHHQADASIEGILVGDSFCDKLEEGQSAGLILNKTPFYAESGGQVGDSGIIQHDNCQFRVEDCKSPYPGLIIHYGTLTRGILLVGEPVEAKIAFLERQKTESHHTAVHLLHWALEKILGNHIEQAGSHVDHNRLRLDITHSKPITYDETQQIEALIQQKIEENTAVTTRIMQLSEVQKRSNIKQLFGEKYGETVRLVDIDFSKELCGGTHVKHLSLLGMVKITKQSALASGVRRLEAVCRDQSFAYVQSQDNFIHHLETKLSASKSKIMDKIEHQLTQIKEQKGQIKALEKSLVEQSISELIASKESIGDIEFVKAELTLTKDSLNSLMDSLLENLNNGIVLIGSRSNNKATLSMRIDKTLSKSLSAKELMKKLSPHIQGGGGGNEKNAQASGKNPGGIQKAFDEIITLLKNQ